MSSIGGVHPEDDKPNCNMVVEEEEEVKLAREPVKNGITGTDHTSDSYNDHHSHKPGQTWKAEEVHTLPPKWALCFLPLILKLTSCQQFKNHISRVRRSPT